MPFTSEELKSKRIAVLMGGLSKEREVSLRSGEACAKALEELGYAPIRIDVQRDIAARLLHEKIEVAFVAPLHGRWGEDGCIQGLLESLFIPYTGSGVLASAVGMDKLFSKQVFLAHGISTPPYAIFDDARALLARPLPFPLPVVVKPTGEGSSVGVTIVHTQEELTRAATTCEGLKGKLLVERYVKGREIQVAVLDDEPLGAIEIVPAREFYDYEAKYGAQGTRYLFPAPLDEKQAAAAHAMALAAHRALGCAGATRTDLILDEKGHYFILEINTLPGMTAASLLPKIAAGKGISFAALCERLLMGAALKG